MMAFRLLLLFRLWLLVSLEMPPDCLHFVLLFLKLFASVSLGFFFLKFVQLLLRATLVVPDISLGGGVSRPIFGIGTFVLLLCLFGFKVLRGSNTCLIRLRHFL